MQKIYLVCSDIFANSLQRHFVSFVSDTTANFYIDSVNKTFNDFSAWWETIEDIAWKMNHDEILKYVESCFVSVEWKMQCCDFRKAHPEFKREENQILLNPKILEINLI